MADFHVQLALDYFQAKSTRERTAVALTGIVAHVAETSLLSAEARRAVLDAALTQAQARGWLHPTAAKEPR